MGDEPEDIRTLKEKLLFYTTAFFILLGTFSLFAFLFLVPFVIEPAFTTIFMEFDTNPALCVTAETTVLHGVKNCSWASCREGCTKDIFLCTQIRVNYRVNYTQDLLNISLTDDDFLILDENPIITGSSKGNRVGRSISDPDPDGPSSSSLPSTSNSSLKRIERGIRDYDYMENDGLPRYNDERSSIAGNHNYYGRKKKVKEVEQKPGKSLAQTILRVIDFDEETLDLDTILDINSNHSFWYYTGAKLFPNVKGCGYPPMLNCSIWLKKFVRRGTNFTCYYSKVDPNLVISDLDMWQNTLNLVFAMAIPIPSFIISVIYLTFAYFKIYNEEEEDALLDKNADEENAEENDEANGEANGGTVNGEVNEENLLNGGIAANSGIIENTTTTTGNTDIINCGDDIIDEICIDVVIPNGATPLSAISGPMTPTSDMNSFGHQLKVKMADEMSRESLDAGIMSNSGSIQGNLSKTMTTSISTPPGPTAAV